MSYVIMCMYKSTCVCFKLACKLLNILWCILLLEVMIYNQKSNAVVIFTGTEKIVT